MVPVPYGDNISHFESDVNKNMKSFPYKLKKYDFSSYYCCKKTLAPFIN